MYILEFLAETKRISDTHKYLLKIKILRVTEKYLNPEIHVFRVFRKHTL